MEKYENEQLHQNGEKKESCFCNQGKLYINQIFLKEILDQWKTKSAVEKTAINSFTKPVSS